jgi:hypothetical protein
LTGAGDDLGFLLVVFGVQDGMDDADALEHAREVFADLDGDGAHQDRPALAVDLLNLTQHGVVFLAPGLVDRVVRVGPAHRFVGGDDQHAQFVDVEKLLRFGFRRAGHARQFVVSRK